MMMYPEVQRKAQEEIDGVIGHDRLPTLADQASLPYVDAVAKEVLRWNPVAPLGTSAIFLRLQGFVRGLTAENEPIRNPTHRY